MNRDVVEEVDGAFVIPLEGFVATYIQNDQDLILCDPDSADEAWLSASCLDVAAMLPLAKSRAGVTRAVVGPDSTLRVDFDDGFTLVNPPEEEVEAWEVRGPGPVLVIGMPGGGAPAVWDATSQVRLIRQGDPLPALVHMILESYEGFPEPAGEFQYRPTARGREAMELHAPNAPPMNRKQIVRFVPPSGKPSKPMDAYLRYTN